MKRTSSKKIDQFQADLDQQKQERLLPLLDKRKKIIREQRTGREKLRQSHADRMKQENQIRRSRYRKGVKGLWDRVTGQHKKIMMRNEAEYDQSLKRNAREWDRLRQNQLKARNQIISKIKAIKTDLQKQQLYLLRVSKLKIERNRQIGAQREISSKQEFIR